MGLVKRNQAKLFDQSVRYFLAFRLHSQPASQPASHFLANLYKSFLIIYLLFHFSSVFAAGAGITYHGRILNPDGTPVTSNNVYFRIEIRTPGNENCLMYSETHLEDLSTTSGVFSVTINDGTAVVPNKEPFTLSDIFRNHGTFNFAPGKCSGGSTYTPNPTDGRKMVVSFDVGSGWETLPSQAINFVPMAIESQTVAGRTPMSFLRVDNTAASTNTTELNGADLTEFWNLINGTSSQYMKSSSSNGASLPVLSTAPGSASAGTIWYNSTGKTIQYFDGTTTHTVGTSGGSVTGITVGSGLVDGLGNTGTTISSSGTIALPDLVTADTYTKVTTDAKGRVISGTNLAQADIPKLTSSGNGVDGSAISGTIGGATVINTSGNITTTGDLSVRSITATGNITNNGDGSTTGVIYGAALQSRRLHLYDDDTDRVTLKTPSNLSGPYSLTLPSDAGTSGQVLSTDGSGILSWTSPGGGGTVTEVTSANADITVATTTTTPKLTLNSGTGPNQIVKLNGSSQLPAVSGVNLTEVSAEKIQGNAVASGTPTGGLLTWNTTLSQWEATNPPSCSASQALKWNSVTSTWSCVSIAVSSTDVTGLGSMATEDASDYLSKAGNLSGLGNAATARTNLGLGSAAVETAGVAANNVLKLDGSGRVPASAIPTAITTNTISADTVTLVNGIKIGSVSTACNAAAEGTIRYNSTDKKMEFCNGTDWKNISSGVLATLSLGSPSSSLVQSGPVNFVVTYGSGVDTATITLSSSDISFGGTATSGCSVTGVTGTGATRTVTVDNCTGTGTVNISVAAGTAKSTTGDSASAAGPSTSYQVDNTGPTAPTGVTLGSVPSNLTNTPTISYTPATDVGGSTVANHQVKIVKTSDSSIVQNWVNHTSGSDIGSLTLETNTEYAVYVRAVDALGNIGTESTAATWTIINDPCLGSPSPGDTCTGGAIYLGSLSPGAISGGSQTDRYMTTPGGCTNSANPTCSGTDSLTKVWYGSGGSYVDIPDLVNYTGTTGTGHGATNTDQHYGDHNTAAIVAHSSIGPDSAAAYCDNLNYGGYTDWYLPNRYELNLFFTNKASIPGLDTSGSWYWSSTEYYTNFAWFERFSDGYQTNGPKYGGYLVRCVRRY